MTSGATGPREQLPAPSGPPAGLTPTPSLRPSTAQSTPPWRIIGLVAAAVAVIGSFLPWVTARTIFGTLEAVGTEGDGQITLVLAIVSVVGFAISKPWLALIPAVGAALVAGNAWRNVASQLNGVDNEFVDASVGIGIYAVVAGGIVAVIASWCMRGARAEAP
jgi:hypothetical protein